jgi:4-hydroxy-2-oxoheptanedioate aldolase
VERVELRFNTAKAQMLAGKPAIGAIASLGSPMAAEVLSRIGFDFVLLDCQHGNWEDDTALLAFHLIGLGPAVPMARVRQNDFYAIGRLLDRGALGIVVPLVNSVAEAQAAAWAVRYPPAGGRSWGPTYAVYHGADYGEWANDEIFLAVQIESAQAVEQAQEILAVEGVDGCWIGPNDLAKSMGLDLNTPAGRSAHQEAILQVLAACQKTHKLPGMFGDGQADTRRWIEHGFQFMTTTSDVRLVLGGGQAILHYLRPPS